MLKKLHLTFVSCALAIASYAQVNLNSGLLAYYPMNGTFNDASGNNHNGTAMNGAAFGNDKWGGANQAAFFDGVDDWVNVGVPSFTLGHTFTIAFTYNSNNARCQNILAKANLTGSPESLQFQIAFNHPSDPNKGLLFGTNHTGNCLFGSSHDLSDRAALSQVMLPNQWVNVVMIFDNGMKTVYLNGTPYYVERAVGNYPNTVDSCTTSPLRMGMWWQNDPLFFSGLLDEVRIYNRALNWQEVYTLNTNYTLGTSKLNRESGVFNVFPNPAQNELNVASTLSTQGMDVTLRNITGQVVFESHFTGNKNRISTSELPSGMYFVEVMSGENRQTFKVQVQH
jgi:hypothetical protein